MSEILIPGRSDKGLLVANTTGDLKETLDRQREAEARRREAFQRKYGKAGAEAILAREATVRARRVSGQ